MNEPCNYILPNDFAFAIKSCTAFFDASDCWYPDVDMSTELTSVNTVHTTSAIIARPLVRPFCPHRNTNTKHVRSDAQLSMLVAVESLDDVSNFANGIANLGREMVICGGGGDRGGDGIGVGCFICSGGKSVGSTT